MIRALLGFVRREVGGHPTTYLLIAGLTALFLIQLWGRNLGVSLGSVYAVSATQFAYTDLVTSTFFHKNVVHLGVNIGMIWLFGRVIEHELGSLSLVAVFLIGDAAAKLMWVAGISSGTLPLGAGIGASVGFLALAGFAMVCVPTSSILAIRVPSFLPRPLQGVLLLETVFLTPNIVGGSVLLVVFLQAMLANTPAGWAHLSGIVVGIFLGAIAQVTRDLRHLNRLPKH